MISISISWFLGCLIAGLIAIVLSIQTGAMKSRITWFWIATLIAELAFLSPFR